MVQATTTPIANRPEEQALLHRLAAGETRAFWQLFQQYRDYLFRCCLKWTNGNSTEAEDLLSQAMLKALEKAQKFAEKITHFKSWLTTLTRNFWLDLKRRPCTNQVEDIEVYAERQEVGRVGVDDTPGSALEEEEKNRVIRAAIDELPTKMRETYCLHFHEELSPQEIVERQGISSQNVYKRISQARAILAKELRGYFIEEEKTNTEVSVTPVAIEPVVEETPLENAGVEPVVDESVMLSAAVAEVESVKSEEEIEGGRDVPHFKSVMVVVTCKGKFVRAKFRNCSQESSFKWISKKNKQGKNLMAGDLFIMNLTENNMNVLLAAKGELGNTIYHSDKGQPGNYQILNQRLQQVQGEANRQSLPPHAYITFSEAMYSKYVKDLNEVLYRVKRPLGIVQNVAALANWETEADKAHLLQEVLKTRNVTLEWYQIDGVNIQNSTFATKFVRVKE